jgi:hypothetical protein
MYFIMWLLLGAPVLAIGSHPKQWVDVDFQQKMLALSRSHRSDDREKALGILANVTANIDPTAAIRILKASLTDKSRKVRCLGALTAAESIRLIAFYGGDVGPLIPILKAMSVDDRVMNEAPVEIEVGRPPEKTAIFAISALYGICQMTVPKPRFQRWKRNLDRKLLNYASRFLNRGWQYDELYADRCLAWGLDSPADHVRAFDLLVKLLRHGPVDTRTKVLAVEDVRTYIGNWGLYDGVRPQYEDLIDVIGNLTEDADYSVKTSARQTIELLRKELKMDAPNP